MRTEACVWERKKRKAERGRSSEAGKGNSGGGGEVFCFFFGENSTGTVEMRVWLVEIVGFGGSARLNRPRLACDFV